MTADLNVARDALNNHLESLKKDNAESKSLIVLIEDLIRFISKQRSLKPVFSYIETLETTTDLESKEVSNIQLSERGIFMSTEKLGNVRIVKLPAMTVASYRAESSTPEDDCSKVFNQFVLKNNLHKRDGFRFFGFNNPSPSEGNPVYGYEMWVTISKDFEVPQPLVKKHFGGGLYASISTQMNEIRERWKRLYDWSKNNDKYDVDFSFQWLEECSMDFETFISEKVKDSEKQLDLLEPIKLK